jgi:hypothetical protein
VKEKNGTLNPEEKKKTTKNLALKPRSISNINFFIVQKSISNIKLENKSLTTNQAN